MIRKSRSIYLPMIHNKEIEKKEREIRMRMCGIPCKSSMYVEPRIIPFLILETKYSFRFSVNYYTISHISWTKYSITLVDFEHTKINSIIWLKSTLWSRTYQSQLLIVKVCACAISFLSTCSVTFFNSYILDLRLN